MHWIIFGAAVFIMVAALFNKAIKVMLKLAIFVVVLLFVFYFLVQDNIIVLPTNGN